MTLAGAKAAVLRGVKFGDLCGLLPSDADRDALRAWFVREPGVPVPPPAAPEPQAALGQCETCGGTRLVRTGTCVTCLDCGSNEGCG